MTSESLERILSVNDSTPSALQTRSTDAICGPAQNFQFALLVGVFNLRDLLSLLHIHCCL